VWGGPTSSDSDSEEDCKVASKEGDKRILKSDEGMKRDTSMMWSGGQPMSP